MVGADENGHSADSLLAATVRESPPPLSKRSPGGRARHLNFCGRRLVGCSRCFLETTSRPAARRTLGATPRDQPFAPTTGKASNPPVAEISAILRLPIVRAPASRQSGPNYRQGRGWRAGAPSTSPCGDAPRRGVAPSPRPESTCRSYTIWTRAQRQVSRQDSPPLPQSVAGGRRPAIDRHRARVRLDVIASSPPGASRMACPRLTVLAVFAWSLWAKR
jgi:hypothetical protein